MAKEHTGVMDALIRKNNSFVILLTLTIVLLEILASEVPRPRGVSLSRAPLYNPQQNFACFDNSKTIPFSQVNDDYCDCPDASDEPGTSACPHGTFHCTNAGHKPLNIASSRVNDGICDCCDGSDEYKSKRVTCPNVCLQLGRHAREEAQRMSELIKAGKQLKVELSQKGIQSKQDSKDRLVELQKNKEEAEKIQAEKKALKDEIEAQETQALEHYRKLEEEERRKKADEEAAKNREEAVETFNKFDSNQDGVVELKELQTRHQFDKDRNGEVSEEEARYFLNNEEAVDLEKFITDAWQNVKPYLMKDAGLFKPPITAEHSSPSEAEDLQGEEELADEEHQDAEGQHHEDEEEGGDEEEEEEEEEEEDEDRAAEEHHVDESPRPAPYDEHTQKLVEQATAARNAYAEAERSVTSIDAEIKTIREYLEKDFGPDEEFATLQGQCFDYADHHEYVYKLCPFDRTGQQPKSGGSETRLGVWSKWDGPEDNVYEAMLYEGGQSCWNGPQRSSKVLVTCGIESKVTSVSEPNRCEYRFEFETPAACRDSQGADGGNEDLHDEL